MEWFHEWNDPGLHPQSASLQNKAGIFFLYVTCYAISVGQAHDPG